MSYVLRYDDELLGEPFEDPDEAEAVYDDLVLDGLEESRLRLVYESEGKE